MNMIKIVFFSDTHLGFDHPIKPKIKRRRRGDEFFANYNRVIDYAIKNKADAIIHGGDLFNRSKTHVSIIHKAFDDLQRAANKNIPIYIVPGNHERSFIQTGIFGAHDNIHIFDKPTCYLFNAKGKSILLAGFPFLRGDIRSNFNAILTQTNWRNFSADYKFLCMHHCVEGATVGVQNFTFKYREDTIKINDIPDEFNAALSGHIHRAQILRTDLYDNKVNVPVVYSGAIERTSFAEREERKGFYKLLLDVSSVDCKFNFIQLPARPMYELKLDTNKIKLLNVIEYIQSKINRLPSDSIVRIIPEGENISDLMKLLTAQTLRGISPNTMNIELSGNYFSKKQIDRRS
jgi:exonuclease SbcD